MSHLVQSLLSSRRQFLAGLTAVGAAAACACTRNDAPAESAAAAQNAGDQIPEAGNQGRICVHHHYGPPMWMKVLAEADALNVEPWKDWTPAKAIESMDRRWRSHLDLVDHRARHLLLGRVRQPAGAARREAEERRRGDGARRQRVRRQDEGRLSRPLRHLGIAAAAARRRKPQGNRVRARHAEARWDRPQHQHRHQVPGRRVVHAGVRGTQPPQDRRLHTSRARRRAAST